jgi:hypothetical protein
MVDYIVLPGVGESVAADDIGGVKHQRVKIQTGADGSATDVSDANPLPVTSSSTSTTTVTSATDAPMPVSDELMPSVLTQLKIMNAYLSILTDTHITVQDVNGGV